MSQNSDIERDELAASLRALAKRTQVIARVGPDRIDGGHRLRQCLGDVLKLLEAATELIYRTSVRIPKLVDPSEQQRASAQGYGLAPPPVAVAESASDLQGTTRALSISEVVDLLGTWRKSGILRVKSAAETFSIQFEDGSVVHANSDRSPPGQRLGDLLVEQGFIEQARLEQFLARHSRAGGKIGVALEREELVTREQLAEALKLQVQLLFHRLFATKDASFSFQERSTDSYDHRVRMSVTQLLLESARAHDESQR